jgi:hypothetical protein
MNQIRVKIEKIRISKVFRNYLCVKSIFNIYSMDFTLLLDDDHNSRVKPGFNLRKSGPKCNGPYTYADGGLIP